jgi:hypothetical protein
MAKAAHAAHPLTADVGGEHRAKAIPPEAHRFMTDIDPAFEKQVFHVPQRQRKRTYMSTTSRSTCGDELNRRKGEGGKARDLRGIRLD